MEPCIRIDKLVTYLDNQCIIKGLSAELRPGQTLALLGRNGAGKTTLINTILGFTLPSSGSVHLWGQPCHNMPMALKHKLGYVPQTSQLLPRLKVKQHLDYFRALRPVWNEARVKAVLGECDIPMDKTVQKLSVGQQQQLAIALAVAHEPELLILDEPVASLDPGARRDFLKLLNHLTEHQPFTALMSSHIVTDLERVATHVWILEDGNLRINAEIDELKETVLRLRLEFSGGTAPAITLPNILARHNSGKHISLMVENITQAQLAQLQQQGFKTTLEPLSLEDLFIGLGPAPRGVIEE